MHFWLCVIGEDAEPDFLISLRVYVYIILIGMAKNTMMDQNKDPFNSTDLLISK